TRVDLTEGHSSDSSSFNWLSVKSTLVFHTSSRPVKPVASSEKKDALLASRYSLLVRAHRPQAAKSCSPGSVGSRSGRSSLPLMEYPSLRSGNVPACLCAHAQAATDGQRLPV